MFEIRLHAGVGHPVSLIALAALGVVVGFVAGMFGVGGGFLLTPILIGWFGIPPPIAVGSALSQKCGTSIASFLKYRDLRRGEPRFDLVMMGGSLIGVDAGARLLAALDRAGTIQIGVERAPIVRVVLDAVFVVPLAVVAAALLRDAWASRRATGGRDDVTVAGPLTRVRIPPYIDLPRVGLASVSVPMLAFLGFFLGAASGLMGIGGGVLFMPILLYGFGLSVRDAAGTGVLLLFVTVAVATFEQALQGYVSLRLSLALLAGSSVGSQLGALATNALPNRILRIVFAALVVATIGLIGVDLQRTLFG